MAGSIGESREIHNHDLSQVPLPKLMVLGSNWGGARKHKHDRVPTSELLHVAGHFQIVLELGNATTLAQIAQWGWAHVQHEPSAPAILWRSGSFELLSHDALQLVTHSGKWAGSALVAKFRSTRPGWTDLTLLGAHINNVAAKMKDNSIKIIQDLRVFAEQHNTQIIFLDANQAAHKRFSDKSVLEDVFCKDQVWIMPEDPVARPLWGRTASAVLNHGMCSGFLLHRDLLAHGTIWRHGHWNAQPIDRRAFAEGDTGWHLPCYLHIQAHAVNTGVRQRSAAAKKRRRQRAQLLRKARQKGLTLPQPIGGVPLDVPDESTDSDDEQQDPTAASSSGPQLRAEEGEPLAHTNAG